MYSTGGAGNGTLPEGKMETLGDIIAKLEEKKSKVVPVIIALGDICISMKRDDWGKYDNSVEDIAKEVSEKYERRIKRIAEIKDVDFPDHYQNFLNWKNIYAEELEKTTIYGLNDNALIASEIMGHDLGSLISAAETMRKFYDDKEDLGKLRENSRAESLMSNIFAMKQFGQVMAYLASGKNEKYIESIPFGNAAKIFSDAIRGEDGNLKVALTSKSDPSAMIDTPEFVSLFEMAKNIAKYGGNSMEMGKRILLSQGEDETTISDYGNGIRHKEGNPAGNEYLPSIFEKGVTTNGTGLGLYFSKLLSTEVRKGSISIHTGFPEDFSKDVVYSTVYPVAVELQDKLRKGTSFTIYTPHIK